MSQIEEYQRMGIRSFIFSGYPHLAECESFGTRVLPHLKTCSLPEVYGRVPTTVPKRLWGWVCGAKVVAINRWLLAHCKNSVVDARVSLLLGRQRKTLVERQKGPPCH